MTRRDAIDFPDHDQLHDARPLAEARAAPPSWYTDPRAHAVDLDLHRQAWQYAAASSEVAAPGSCLVTEVAGASVVVVRGDDGVLRAFHNVCRHRGGPLVRGSCTVPRLQCGYHGWTYALDGRLLGTPQMGGATGFDRASESLLPVHVTEWQGLCFVSLAADPPPLATQLAGVAEALLPVRLHTKRFAVREVYAVDCNWKTYVENYLEAYHLPKVHPEYFRTLDFNAYRYEVHEGWSVQRAPLGADAGYYLSLKAQGAEPASDACYAWLWPNLTLNVLPGRVQVNHVRPLAVDRCEVVFDYYYDDPQAMAELVAEDRAVSARIQAEDADICAVVQRNLASGGYRPGRLSPEHEVALHAFQAQLRRAYLDRLAHRSPEIPLRSIR
jgi:choline monooxygenase